MFLMNLLAFPFLRMWTRLTHHQQQAADYVSRRRRDGRWPEKETTPFKGWSNTEGNRRQKIQYEHWWEDTECHIGKVLFK